jgi:Ca2+-binding EF-hand superfamily protein
MSSDFADAEAEASSESAHLAPLESADSGVADPGVTSEPESASDPPMDTTLHEINHDNVNPDVIPDTNNDLIPPKIRTPSPQIATILPPKLSFNEEESRSFSPASLTETAAAPPSTLDAVIDQEQGANSAIAEAAHRREINVKESPVPVSSSETEPPQEKSLVDAEGEPRAPPIVSAPAAEGERVAPKAKPRRDDVALTVALLDGELRSWGQKWRANNGTAKTDAIFAPLYVDNSNCIDLERFREFVSSLPLVVMQTVSAESRATVFPRLYRRVCGNTDNVLTTQMLEDYMYGKPNEEQVAKSADEIIGRLYKECGGNTSWLFGEMDVEFTGCLGGSEMREFLLNNSLSLTRSEAEVALRLLDKDGDGCVSYNDTRRYLAARFPSLQSDEEEEEEEEEDREQEGRPEDADEADPRGRRDSRRTSSSRSSDSARAEAKDADEGGQRRPQEQQELTYSEAVRLFRSGLLGNAEGVKSAKKKVKTVFQRIDADGNGILTTAELHSLIDELGVLRDSANSAHMTGMLIDQIDINRYTAQRELPSYIIETCISKMILAPCVCIRACI